MTVTIEMPEAMERRVRERCEREGRSVGEGVVAAVVAWLEVDRRGGSVRALKGMLGHRGRAVPLEEMERAVGTGGDWRGCLRRRSWWWNTGKRRNGRWRGSGRGRRIFRII